jgi:hypothetical protein
MTTDRDSRVLRALSAAHAEIGRLRGLVGGNGNGTTVSPISLARFNPSGGNPYHDAEGHFTHQGNEGHAAQQGKAPRKGRKAGQPGKHAERRAKWRAKRKAELEQLRKDYKGEGKKLKATHKKERAETLRDQKAARKEQAKDHANDWKEHRKWEVGEKKELFRDQKKERADLIKEHKSDIQYQERQHARKMEKMEGAHAGERAKHEEAQTAKADKLKAARDRHKDNPEKLAKIEGLEKRLEKQTAAKAKRLARRHDKQKADAIDAHKDDLAGRHENHASEVADQKERHKSDRADKVEEFHDARKNLREEHKEARKTLRQEHKDERDERVAYQKDERQDLLKDLQANLEESGFRRKGGGKPTEVPAKKRDRKGKGGGGSEGESQGRSIDEIPLRHATAALSQAASRDRREALLPSSLSRRFATHRTHKASSAESILRACLKARGWTKQYGRGELTGEQHLDLLSDVREYGRAWLHHEAEGLFRQYGNGNGAATAATDTGRSAHGLGGVAELHGGSGVRGGNDPDDRLVALGADSPGLPAPSLSRALSATLRYHVGRFFDRARLFIRDLIVAGAMALGGPEPLSTSDLQEAERQVAVQHQYLDRFHAEAIVVPPVEIGEPSGVALHQPMTAAEFAARAELYGNSAWTAASAVHRQSVIQSGRFTEERRYHQRPASQDHPCGTCKAESDKGWVPVGMLRTIGDSECLGNMCDCFFVYRNGPDGVAHVGGRRVASVA